MTVTLAQIRTAIQDVPKVQPPTSSPPEVMDTADGTKRTFFFRWPPLTDGGYPMTILFGTMQGGTSNTPGVMTWAEIAPTDATHPWSLQAGLYGAPAVVFVTPPLAGVQVGARYMVAMFSDDELADYQTRARSFGDDRSTLNGIVADLIGVILTSDDKFRKYTLGDTVTDPADVRAALTTRLQAITSDLQQPAAVARPAVGFVAGCIPRYI